MAGNEGGKLAEAYVEIGTKDARLDSGLASAKGKLATFMDSVKSQAANILSTLGPLTAAFVGIDAFKKAIVGAADLNETISKTETVFGKASAAVFKFADDMNAKFGTSKQSILDAAAGIGLVGKASGLSQPAAADLSIQLAKLADDASSFYNVPLEDALLTIKSALVGESEPIRKFGVLLNEAAVQAEAMRLGLVKAGATLTEGQKVMARSSLIISGMKDATGDHEKTQSSFSNQMKELQGRMEGLATTIASETVPALESILGTINPLISGLQKLTAESRSSIDALGEFSGLGIVSSILGGVNPLAGVAIKGQLAKKPEFVGGDGGANFAPTGKETLDRLANTVLSRLGVALGIGNDLKGLALSGVGVAGNQLFRDQKKSLNVGFTDSESYARELQEGGLRQLDKQQEMVDEQKKAVKELEAIKNAVKNKAGGLIKAVFG